MSKQILPRKPRGIWSKITALAGGFVLLTGVPMLRTSLSHGLFLLLLAGIIFLLSYLLRRKETGKSDTLLAGISPSRKAAVIGLIVYAAGLIIQLEEKTAGAYITAASVPFFLYSVISWLVQRAKNRPAKTIVLPENPEAANAFLEWFEDKLGSGPNHEIVSATIVSSSTRNKSRTIAYPAFWGKSSGRTGWPLAFTQQTYSRTGYVTFAVLYASGRRSLETVKAGSKRFNELARYTA